MNKRLFGSAFGSQTVENVVIAPRRQAILEVAQRLFRESGFPATSVRDIAAAMGIQPGSLYAHIEKKEDLLWESANAAGDRFFEMIEPVVASDRVITEKLRDAIRGHVRVITDDLDAAAVFANEWRHLSEARRAQFIERRDRYQGLFAELVRQGIEAGHFADCDPRVATLFIMSSLNWIYQWFRRDGRMTADELARTMSDFIFDGLRKRSA